MQTENSEIRQPVASERPQHDASKCHPSFTAHQSGLVTFCHRCGFPHAQQFCPRCGHRQCVACGDG